MLQETQLSCDIFEQFLLNRGLVYCRDFSSADFEQEHVQIFKNMLSVEIENVAWLSYKEFIYKYKNLSQFSLSTKTHNLFGQCTADYCSTLVYCRLLQYAPKAQFGKSSSQYKYFPTNPGLNKFWKNQMFFLSEDLCLKFNKKEQDFKKDIRYFNHSDNQKTLKQEDDF